MTTLAENIQVQANDLPPELQKEVLDFIGYLRSKTQQSSNPRWVEQAWGIAPDFPDRPAQPELDPERSLS